MDFSRVFKLVIEDLLWLGCSFCKEWEGMFSGH